MINLSTTIKRSNQAISRNVKDHVYILDARSGEIRTLNEVAGFIWSLTKRKTTIQDVLSNVCSIYDIDKSTAKNDVVEFVEKYLKLGMLEEVKGS